MTRTVDQVEKHLAEGGQILKTRDDSVPVFFVPSESGEEGRKTFALAEDTDCSWVKAKEYFGAEKIRPRIEPWLTALAQSEHLSLLVGSGLTHSVHHVARGDRMPGMDKVEFSICNEKIESETKRLSDATGRYKGNIEDQLRVANELLRGLEIMESAPSPKAGEQKTDEGKGEDKKSEKLKKEIVKALGNFANQLLKGEQNLLLAEPQKREQAFNYLISFLMSFASRSGTRERLHIFTTNYDRYIEAGADIAGLRLIDRFVGTLTPIFRASRLDVDLHYNPPGIRGEPRYLEGVARFTKLHGSVDWVDCNGTIRRIGMPFGACDINPFLSALGLKDADAMKLMIYPNAAKDRETVLFPYVEMFRDFAAAICRPNNTLVCYGYSFGDEHINRVIEDMLTIPSAHLVVIAYGDPLGRIMRTYERLGRSAQISLLMGNHLGDLQELVRHYLPKPAIDRTTFRMAELLKARWSTGQSEDGETESKSSKDEGGTKP